VVHEPGERNVTTPEGVIDQVAARIADYEFLWSQ
jgi:hypothetical protein